MQNEFDKYFSGLLNFFRVEEAEQKKRYDNAIDIEDMAEATSVTIDARNKIQQLRKWIEDIQRISQEVASAYPITLTVEQEALQEVSHVADSLPTEATTQRKEAESEIEEPKVGAYVRNKLQELSQSGHRFSLDDIDAFQQKRWSKEMLNLNFPFVKEYNPSVPLHNQLSTDNGANRYWAEVFDFGENRLLFCSQWYYGDRVYFDHWYESRVIPQLEKDNFIEGFVESGVEQETPEGFVSSDGSDGFDIVSPQKFILFGKNYSVSNWQELLTKLCEAMVLMKPYKLASLSLMPVMGAGRQMLSLDEQQIPEPRTKLSNGFYMSNAGSPKEIKIRCELILKACGYSSDVLQIC